MIFNNTEILPGESRRLDINIARLPSRSPIDIHILISRARKPGPVLLLTGGLHGDEINGVEIIRRIIQKGYHVPDKGTVICIPIINIYGFIHFSRYVPDGKDVNRSFPGNKKGSLASRVAHYLTHEIIPKIDYGIDFHTGGAERSNHPQIRCVMTDKINAELASVFCAPFTLHSALRPKSLRQIAAKNGKKILVYEGGESARFDEKAIRHGINGTLRILKHLKMRSGKLVPLKHANIKVEKSTWLRAQASGIFQCKVSSGTPVKKGQIVGYITDPFGDFKLTVKSKVQGFVIGLNNNPIVHQGDALMHLGVINS